MKSIVPNYDFTVYNMNSEPMVRTVEKYYGGATACYFACKDPVFDENTGEMLMESDGITPQ